MLDIFWYKVLAYFPITGLLGIDELALRSPLTATLKFLVNVSFYGAWYFYDIFQLIFDSDLIAKYGLSAPYGPRGHGYKFFSNVTENNTNELPNPSPYNGGITSTILYIAYAMTTLYWSFTGFPSLIAGDYMGGIFKIISLCFIITFPIYLFTGIFEYFKSGQIEKQGVPRTWPFVPGLMAFFMHDPNYNAPAENLISGKVLEDQREVYEKNVKYYHEVTQEGRKTPFQRAWEALYHLPDPYLGAGKLAGAGADAVQAGAEVTKATANAFKQIAKEHPEALLPSPPAPSAALPSAPPANAAAAPQVGGGLIANGSEFDYILYSGIAFLFVGGLAASLLRKMTTPKRRDDEYPRRSYEGDDAPPDPRTV